MKILLQTLLLTGVLSSFCLSGYCEYYQYRDENGVLRFTDDFSRVPVAQRTGVQINPSVAGDADRPFAEDDLLNDAIAQEDPSASDSAESEDGWEEEIQEQINALNRMNHTLMKNYASLQQERSLLEKREPGQRSSKQEWDTFRNEVEALNKKIAGYESQVAAYEARKKSLEERLAN